MTFTIRPDKLAVLNPEMKWVVEPGDFTIMIGTASDDVQEAKLRVE